MASVVNVALFAVLGCLVAMVSRRPVVIVAAYVAICTMVTLAEAWGAGFTATFFSSKDLAVAFALYALPFAIVWWSNRRLTESRR
jgi:putative Ca2+/H+ antiporter (TMEM165/GDT1 family)